MGSTNDSGPPSALRPSRASGRLPSLGCATVTLFVVFTVVWWLRARPMTVLVFGANGWIGAQVVQALERGGVRAVRAATRPGQQPDAAVRDEIRRVRPTHVVSVLGRTHGPGAPTIDYLEGGPDKLLINVRDNLYAPILLARLCEREAVHFTYIGTGCIFKYDEAHQPRGLPQSEEDVPNFFGSSYSVVKGFTDRLLHHFAENTLNLRIRMPFNDDDHPRNFIVKLAKYSRVINVPNSITYLPDALDVMINLMKRKETGTLNLVSPGAVDHKTVLDLYRAIVNSSHTVAIVTPEVQRQTLAADRSNTELDTRRLQALAPRMRPVEEALTQAMEGIRRQRELARSPGG